MKKFISFVALLVVVSGGTACAKEKQLKVTLGHFPNITHAQALIAQAEGRVEKAFGDKVQVDWKVFNAGPSAVEALFAGNLDITVIGPSPAINAFVKSNGEAARVVAGSASGGAALLVRGDLNLKSAEDFRGKKIASPQLGNTQDVALRAWLAGSNLKLKDQGGDVQVLPIANADQVTLLAKKDIDAAWTVEPWVSILSEKTGAKVFLEESELWAGGKYSTALILVRKKFLDEHPDLVKKFLQVHVETTDWINSDPEAAKKVVKAEIEKETGKDLPQSILDASFKRVQFTVEPLPATIREQAKSAYTAGFLKSEPDLAGLFDVTLLAEILQEKGVKADWLEEVPQK